MSRSSADASDRQLVIGAHAATSDGHIALEISSHRCRALERRRHSCVFARRLHATKERSPVAKSRLESIERRVEALAYATAPTIDEPDAVRSGQLSFDRREREFEADCGCFGEGNRASSHNARIAARDEP